MKFKEQHPEYENYSNVKYVMQEIPNSAVGAFQGYLIRKITSTQDFINIVQIIAGYVPCETRGNWGFPYIKKDLDEVIWALYDKKRFHKFMDCLDEIISKYLNDEDSIEDINEILDDSKIGYTLLYDRVSGALWNERVDTEKRAKEIVEILSTLDSSYTNAIQHLEQSKEQLKRFEIPRARKDALRDCISAFEAIVGYITQNDDVSKGLKELEIRNSFNKKIIREGQGIWSYINNTLEDVRHGSNKDITLTEEEGRYWIERTTAIVKYIASTEKAYN